MNHGPYNLTSANYNITSKLVHLKSEVSRYWSNSSRAQNPEEGQSSDNTTHLKTKSLFYIPV